MSKINIPIKKLLTDAIIPMYATDGSAGFDFYTIIDTVVWEGETQLIRTGLSMEIPVGYELQIRPRSGLSLSTKLRVANSPGTIDSDYRGEIKIIIENIGDNEVLINQGDRIAQGVLCKVPQANFIEVDKLDETERGDGGFGSTDKN